MILYHFTSLHHLPAILRLGILTTTESNVSPMRAHAGPDVVWLTKDEDPAAGDLEWASLSVWDKTEVRFTVDLNRRNAKEWLSWSTERGMKKYWRDALIKTGGGMHAARGWYVATRPILQSEWKAVHVRTDDGWVEGPKHIEEFVG